MKQILLKKLQETLKKLVCKKVKPILLSKITFEKVLTFYLLLQLQEKRVSSLSEQESMLSRAGQNS